MRIFIAIDLNKGTKDAIFSEERKLKNNISGVKWVEYENLHITLKFLGEVDEEKIKYVKDALIKVSSNFNDFEINGGYLGAFPSPDRARVLFFNIEEGKEHLYRIFDKLEKRLSQIGFEKDQRPYHPHITIGRVKRRYINVKGYTQRHVQFRQSAGGITLFKSTLTPSGPIYTKLLKGEFR